MVTVLSIAFAGVLFYLVLTLGLTYLVQQIPRNPVEDKPDWGKIMDTKIPATDGGLLEVWRIDPMEASTGVVVFAHGWGRNRDRMVHRARIFGEWGFTTVIHSARDHGKSSSRRFMNPLRFAEDIEAVLNWLAEPVILYGHSMGAAAAIIAASRNPQKIRLLFLEGCYADTKEALLSLYKMGSTVFRHLFRTHDRILDESFLQKRPQHGQPGTAGAAFNNAGDAHPWRNRSALPRQICLPTQRQLLIRPP